MQDRSLKEDVPSIPRGEIVERLNANLSRVAGVRVTPEELVYCSWPETFANTSGPFERVGGSSLTEVRMEAWVWERWAIIFCAGKVVRFSEFQISAKWGVR